MIWNLIRNIMEFILCKILHISLSKEKMDSLLQFIKFGLVGLSNTMVHYLIYLLCMWFGIYYILANFIAFTVSVLNSFFWNNKYVFTAGEGRNQGWLPILVKTYISYGFTGILLNSLLLYVEVDLLGLNQLIAPFFNLLVTIPLNFIINKFWAYKAK